eukprot:696040-Alexandrium_andersonii.AAC.1
MADSAREVRANWESAYFRESLVLRLRHVRPTSVVKSCALKGPSIFKSLCRLLRGERFLLTHIQLALH